MAVVLICLLIGFFSKNTGMFSLSILFLLLDMVACKVYTPVAKIWFGISNILGTIMSKVILTVIFFALVTPIGVIRRLSGADPLQLKKWKKGSESVFTVRDHHFESKEIEKPY